MKKELIPERYDDVVGIVLGDMRRKRCFTQADLGRAALLPQSAVSRVELGVRKLSITELRRVALCLDVTPGELLDRFEAAARGAGVAGETRPEMMERVYKARQSGGSDDASGN